MCRSVLAQRLFCWNGAGSVCDLLRTDERITNYEIVNVEHGHRAATTFPAPFLSSSSPPPSPSPLYIFILFSFFPLPHSLLSHLRASSFVTIFSFRCFFFLLNLQTLCHHRNAILFHPLLSARMTTLFNIRFNLEIVKRPKCVYIVGRCEISPSLPLSPSASRGRVFWR